MPTTGKTAQRADPPGSGSGASASHVREGTVIVGEMSQKERKMRSSAQSRERCTGGRSPQVLKPRVALVASPPLPTTNKLLFQTCSLPTFVTPFFLSQAYTLGLPRTLVWNFRNF